MLLFRNGQQFYFATREPTTMPGTYLSFLVRLWHEPNTESPVQLTHWKGEVEHIQSGQRWTFETLDEVLSFLRQQVSDPEMSSRSADE